MPVVFFFSEGEQHIHQSTYHAFIDYINLCYNRSDTPLLGLTRVKNKETNLNSRNIGSVFMVLVHSTIVCLVSLS